MKAKACPRRCRGGWTYRLDAQPTNSKAAAFARGQPLIALADQLQPRSYWPDGERKCTLDFVGGKFTALRASRWRAAPVSMGVRDCPHIKR